MDDETEDVPLADRAARLPLGRLLPILLALMLIAGGAIAGVAEISNSVLALLGDVNIALFRGLLLAVLVARPFGCRRGRHAAHRWATYDR